MITRTEVASFRDEVARRLGLQFDDDRFDELARMIETRCEETRVDPHVYLHGLSAHEPAAREELRLLARRLTVNETYFFRHREQLGAFIDSAFPDRLRGARGVGPVSILSAGCASGEEPYTLVMLIREAHPRLRFPTDVRVRAFDLSSSMLEKATRGRYSSWSLRDTPLELSRRYFQPVEGGFQLDPEVRAAVQLEEHNLADPDPHLYQPGSLDIIFCRNVLMYFSHQLIRTIITRMARALRPGGYLFLGHAETLRGISTSFHLCHSDGAFYYQLRGEGEPERELPPSPPSWVGLPPVTHDGAAAPDTPDLRWMTTIENASNRIATLAGSTASAPGPTAAAPAAAAPSRRQASLHRDAALALLREERFDEALGRLRQVTPEVERDPDTQLLEAILLLNAGRPAEAQQVCDQLLGQDEMNPGAHHVLALCREQRGDPTGAREQHQVAAYLDPGFGMPHLRLGVLARRAGNLDGARRELEQASRLLAREEDGRILLFAGGFGRAAVMQVCQAELRACGGGRRS